MKNKKLKERIKKPLLNYSFQFSSVSILSFVLCTHLVLLLVVLISRSGSFALEMQSIFRSLVFSLLLSGLISFFLNKIFIAPLVKLTEAMKKVAAGDFTIQLKQHNKLTDLNEAYDSFNTMVKELANTDTLQTDFVSAVSHEFKTPINAIEGYASLLQDSELSDEEKENYVEKIMFNTSRLSELVGNVLLLSKLDNQSMQPKKSSYRLDEQIRKAILGLESKWDRKEIDFDIELDAIEYTGNEVLMSHVWSNLIDNAVKFSNQGGNVMLRLVKADGKAVFTIRNFGEHIPEKHIGRIFTKFYQADTSRKSEGNGLGLSLVKNIVDGSGGSVFVESSPEKGTLFTVSLPL